MGVLWLPNKAILYVIAERRQEGRRLVNKLSASDAKTAAKKNIRPQFPQLQNGDTMKSVTGIENRMKKLNCLVHIRFE